MGVLNVTPDSFSDGGRFLDLDDAVAHGVALRAAGADLVDVGGESTRPGAERVDADEETAPGAAGDHASWSPQGVPVSIDTTRAAVAAAALEAGAASSTTCPAGSPTRGWPRSSRTPGCRGSSCTGAGTATACSAGRYEDVLGEVRAELVARVDAAVLAGVDPARLVLDPGLGFAKNAAHNWALLRRLDVLLALGFPVLVGASRKRFLGQLLADADGAPRPPAGREAATAAITALAADAGPGGCGCTTCASSMDAVAVARRAAGRVPRPTRRTAGRERPDRAARAAGARPPRGVRARAPRRAGLRRRRHGLDGPRPAAASDDLADTLALRRARRAAAAIVGGRAGNLSRRGRPASRTMCSPTRGCARSRSRCTSRRPRSRWSSPTSRWSSARSAGERSP